MFCVCVRAVQHISNNLGGIFRPRQHKSRSDVINNVPPREIYVHARAIIKPSSSFKFQICLFFQNLLNLYISIGNWRLLFPIWQGPSDHTCTYLFWMRGYSVPINIENLKNPPLFWSPKMCQNSVAFYNKVHVYIDSPMRRK